MYNEHGVDRKKSEVPFVKEKSEPGFTVDDAKCFDSIALSQRIHHSYSHSTANFATPDKLYSDMSYCLRQGYQLEMHLSHKSRLSLSHVI